MRVRLMGRGRLGNAVGAGVAALETNKNVARPHLRWAYYPPPTDGLTEFGPTVRNDVDPPSPPSDLE